MSRESSNPPLNSGPAAAPESRNRRRASGSQPPAGAPPSGEIVCLISRRLLSGLERPDKAPAISRAIQQGIKRRRHFVKRIVKLIAGGLSLNAACHKLGLPSTTGWKWYNLYVLLGDAGLAPRLNRCGRKPILLVTGAAARDLERLVVLSGSVSAGARLFADRPTCPPALAARLKSRGDVTPSFRRDLAFRTIPARVRVGRHFAAVIIPLP